jgi:hypothetical protein
LVLDADGRIAASIIGELPSRLTLVDVVEEVESGGAGEGEGDDLSGSRSSSDR